MRECGVKRITLVMVAALAAGCGSAERREPPAAVFTALPVPMPAQAAVERGHKLAGQGLYESALAEFERAIDINPTMTSAYIGAGDIYRGRGDFETSERRYARAAQLEPRNFDAQYGHGLALQLLNRVADAVRAYLRALTIRPNDFDANLNVGTAYLQLGEPNQALPYARRAVRLDAESGPARVNLGATYAALGRHAEAVVEFQQAAELMELTPELLLNLADSLGKTGRYEEMAGTLEQLIRRSPSALAYERLGTARFRLKRYDEALEAFHKATELDERHYPAWNGVAVCMLNRYLWSGKKDVAALDEAVEAMRRSIRLERRQPKIVELLTRYG